MKPDLEEIQAKIDTAEPEIELLAVEEAGGGSLRLLIDHPDGVDLETCQRVTDLLGELRERYSLEVSSPGPTRPLSKPEHFTRFEGRRAKIRTSEPIAGQRSFTGTITGVAAGGVILDQGEPVTIPLDKVDRAHLAPTAEKPTRSN